MMNEKIEKEEKMSCQVDYVESLLSRLDGTI